VRRTFNDVATLAARIGVGAIFFANGWHKLEAGLTATGQQFSAQGAPAPGVWAAAAMLIELLGGALLIAGLFVPVCGILLFAEALAVFAVASGDKGLPLTGGDTNLIVALGAASILLAVVGGGRLSVDHMVVIRRRDAEEAEDFAAEAEADAVIASLREPRPGAGKATGPEQGNPGTAPTNPKGPVTFPRGAPAEEPSDPEDATEVSSRNRRNRPRRPDSGSGTTTSRSEPPPAPREKVGTSGDKGDKLVAGRQETPGTK
jgi:putative oxidoreductase